MKGVDQIIDLSNPREKRNLISDISLRKGLHRVTIKQHREVRSIGFNRYLWGVVYQKFVEFRQDQGEDFDKLDAHSFFGDKYLRVPVCDLDTGEVIGWRIRSTASLETPEFAEYVEKIIAFEAHYGIEVPPPDRTIVEAAS